MKMERLISILLLLSEHEMISATKLAEKFEVSVRTIYRDIESLSLSGFPIQTQAGVNGGVRLMDEFKIDKSFFSLSDLTSLFIALENLPIDLSILSPKAVHTFEKLKTLIPKEHKEEVQKKADQISIDFTAWTNSGYVQPYFEQIKLAIDECKKITFVYEDRAGKKSSREVEPYQLILKEVSWYFRGFCLDRKDFRVFKLSRMSDLNMTSACFIPRKYVAEPLGREKWGKKEFISVQLSVHSSVKDEIIEKFHIEKIEELSDADKYVITFPFMEDEFGYRLILGFGTKCECLGPKKIRDELKKRIEQLSAMYQ